MVIDGSQVVRKSTATVVLSKVVDLADMEEREVRELDISENIVELTRRMPVWLHPHAGLETPMCEALGYAAQALEEWIARHPDSFPPIIINITDGEATDGDPEPVAQSIQGLRTSDGNALMFNCHLSEISARTIEYPERESRLPDIYARQMFRMSSVMPPLFLQHATAQGIRVGELSRCYVFKNPLNKLN